MVRPVRVDRVGAREGQGGTRRFNSRRESGHRRRRRTVHPAQHPRFTHAGVRRYRHREAGAADGGYAPGGDGQGHHRQRAVSGNE